MRCDAEMLHRAGEWANLEVRDTDGSFEDQGLNPDSTYYYALQACNAAGCSELSLETGGVTESSGQVEPPVAPLLSAETREVSALFVWNTFIDLSWDAVDGATYYEVYKGGSLDSTVECSLDHVEFLRPRRFLSSQGVQQDWVLAILEHKFARRIEGSAEAYAVGKSI